jgi:hypothetical protein
MRNTTSRLAIAAVLAAGLAAPALADVTVTVDVSKDKDIFVFETITITKDVTISVDIVLFLDGAAEAQALANIKNENNFVSYSDLEIDTDFAASIVGAMVGNSGIVGVNQDAGYNVKQGNLVAVALVDSGRAFANSQAEADQLNSGHTVILGGGPRTKSYSTLILDTWNFGTGGVHQLNQNAGNNNSQLNLVAVAAGLATADEEDVTVALSEAALGQETSNNLVVETGTYKTADITGSLNGNIGGVLQVNQASGNNANQANLVSVAAYVTP